MGKLRKSVRKNHRASNSRGGFGGNTGGNTGGITSPGGTATGNVQCSCYAPQYYPAAEQVCEEWCPEGYDYPYHTYYITGGGMYDIPYEQCNIECAQFCADMLSNLGAVVVCNVVGSATTMFPCNQCDNSIMAELWQNVCPENLDSGLWDWTWTCDYDQHGNGPNWNTDLSCQNLHPHTDCGTGSYWGWDEDSQSCKCKTWLEGGTWIDEGEIIYDNIGVNSGGQCYKYLWFYDWPQDHECHSQNPADWCTDECSVDYDSASQDMWDPASCCMKQYKNGNEPWDVSEWEAIMPEQSEDCSGIPNPSSQKYRCRHLNPPSPYVTGSIKSRGRGGLGIKPNPNKGKRYHHKGGRGRYKTPPKRGRLIRR